MNNIKKSVKISIIVPIYNVAAYLPRFLKSIQSQLFKDYEVILVDDGSTDNSLKICYKFKESDNRIRIAHQKNLGSGAARNTGLSLAKGKYIYFCDPDDYIENSLLLDNYRLAEKTKAQMVLFGYTNMLDNRQINIVLPSHKHIKSQKDFISSFPNLLEEGLLYCVWNKLYLKDSINDLKFETVRVGQDVRFNYKYYRNIDNIVCNDRSYYYYTLSRPGSAQTKKNLDKVQFRVEELSRLEELVYDNWKQYNEKFNRLMVRQYISMCMFNVKFIEESPQKEKKIPIMRKLINYPSVKQNLKLSFSNSLSDNLKIIFLRSATFPGVMWIHKKYRHIKRKENNA